jgi:hypothetical protein
MRKLFLLTTLITLLFVLTACGGPSADGATNSTSANGFRSSSAAIGPLNAEEKLALGTIKLDGTKQAVDPKMAASLVPLWQLLFQLNSTSSSAPQEVTAVVDQIKTTMTPDQVSTINNMPLTQADIFTVFQQDAQQNGTGGAASGGGTGPSNFPGGNGRNRGGGGGGGFVFAGGGGPGGGGFGGGFRNNAGSSTTPQDSAQTAAQAAQARQNAISNLLINQVIRLLETKLRG